MIKSWITLVYTNSSAKNKIKIKSTQCPWTTVHNVQTVVCKLRTVSGFLDGCYFEYGICLGHLETELAGVSLWRRGDKAWRRISAARQHQIIFFI